ncbi:MAG: hypothetical protein HY518_04905 [Candidatus Aenigmarchaeota archaeon]|nr:hypothetical protein [Candidatus Aenigmarchaeota archaeon]
MFHPENNRKRIVSAVRIRKPDGTWNEMLSGQVYSIVTLLLVIPLLLFIIFFISSSQTIRYGTIEKVIADQLHQVEKSVENDFQKAVSISGQRALIAASDSVLSTGAYIDNSSARLGELMENGSLYGNPTFLMENNSIPDWILLMQGVQTGFDLQINHSGLAASNLDGFNLNAEVMLTIDIKDRLDVARIARTFPATVKIPVENVEDPTAAIGTQNLATRNIVRYPYSYYAKSMVAGSASYGNCTGTATFDPGAVNPGSKILIVSDASTAPGGFLGYVGEAAGVPAASCYIAGAANAVALANATITQSNYSEVYLDELTKGAWSLPVNDAVEKGYYSHFPGTSGPDILQRLEGNLNESSNGLESFVNVDDLISAGAGIKGPDQSSLDYLYYQIGINNGQKVRGLPDKFRISAADGSRYGLTGLM